MAAGPTEFRPLPHVARQPTASHAFSYQYILRNQLTLVSVHLQSDCYSHIALLRYDSPFLYLPTHIKVHTCHSVGCGCLHEQRYGSERNAKRRNTTLRYESQSDATQHNGSQSEANASLRNATLRIVKRRNATLRIAKRRNAT